MKKNIFISAIFFISLFLISCNSENKGSGGATGTSEAVSDSIEYYVDKYVKEVESIDALSVIAKEKGDTDFLENEFAERKETLTETLSKIEAYSENMTDEMKVQKENADKMKGAAEKVISEVLQGK